MNMAFTESKPALNLKASIQKLECGLMRVSGHLGPAEWKLSSHNIFLFPIKLFSRHLIPPSITPSSIFHLAVAIKMSLF